MKNKKCHTIGTEAKSIPLLTQIYDRSLSWLGINNYLKFLSSLFNVLVILQTRVSLDIQYTELQCFKSTA